MLLPLADARARLLSLVASGQDSGISQPLNTAMGGILAEDIRAPRSLPPFHNSAVDGYGVRLADVVPGVALPLGGRAAAGHPLASLPAGHAARVLTGAVIPDGVEAVVMQEDCHVSEAGITLGTIPPIGDNIRWAGEDIAADSLAIPAGTRLNAGHLALLAGLGLTHGRLRKAVRIGFLSTGDEIIPAGHAVPPRHSPGTIYDSNRPLVLGLGAALGAEMVDLGHVGDNLEETIAGLASAKDYDCAAVITLGGASVGDADFVKPAVEALGSVDFWRLALKPGKPVAIGRVGAMPFLGLPGNPGAVYTGFLFLAGPLIRQLQGRCGRLFPHPSRVEAAFTRTTGPWRAEVIACGRDDAGRATLLPAQGSGNLTARALAEGVVLLPAKTTVQPGDWLDWYSYADLIA